MAFADPTQEAAGKQVHQLADSVLQYDPKVGTREGYMS